MTTITPNMNIPVPTPSETAGPAWAIGIVADMSVIDSHDHSSGKGVPITPDGLNISADLPMGDNNLTEVRSVNFTAQVAPLAEPTDLGCLYVSGADLYYNDEAGNQVRITQAGSVTGATGTITGLPSGTASASYAGGTFTFQSATSTPAVMAVGPLEIGRQVASSNTVTITPDAAQASDYDITLPAALPAATYPLTITSAGSVAASGTVLLAAGTAGAPSASFAADTDTGIYNSAANEINISTGGTSRVNVSSAGAAVTGAVSASTVVLGGNGAVGAPTYSFSTDTDTGVYRSAADTVAVSVGGTKVLSVDSTALTPSGIYVRGIDGDAGTPAYSFSADTNTGIYRRAADQIGMSIGGAETLVIASPGVNVVGGVDTDSGGYIKWKVFTGSLAASGSTTLAGPGTLVLGATGVTTSNGASDYTVMRSNLGDSPSTIASICFDTLTAANGVPLENMDTNSTNSYRVVMFYQ